MKRQIIIALSLALASALPSCGGSGNQKTEEPKQEEKTEETATQPEKQPDPEATASTSDPAALAKAYDCMKCPFSIKIGDQKGKEFYFRNASTLVSWSYSELNTDGWYYFNDRLISKDGKYAIGPDIEAFSSFCEYEAKPYDGETLSPEEQANVKTGVVYQKQSFLPMFVTRVQIKGNLSNKELNDVDIPLCQLYGFRDMFVPGEELSFYISNTSFDNEQFPIENARICIFPHSEGATKQVMLNDEMKAKAFACLDYMLPENEGEYNFAFQAPDIPEGSGSLLVDFIFTYNDIVCQYFVIEIVQAE